MQDQDVTTLLSNTSPLTKGHGLRVELVRRYAPSRDCDFGRLPEQADGFI